VIHCNQQVLAFAYMARHGLVWTADPSGSLMACRYTVYSPVARSRLSSGTFTGIGFSLYEAVLDYQSKTGIGFNS
jgi:hypothetical protein